MYPLFQVGQRHRSWTVSTGLRETCLECRIASNSEANSTGIGPSLRHSQHPDCCVHTCAAVGMEWACVFQAFRRGIILPSTLSTNSSSLYSIRRTFSVGLSRTRNSLHTQCAVQSCPFATSTTLAEFAPCHAHGVAWAMRLRPVSRTAIIPFRMDVSRA